MAVTGTEKSVNQLQKFFAVRAILVLKKTTQRRKFYQYFFIKGKDSFIFSIFCSAPQGCKPENFEETSLLAEKHVTICPQAKYRKKKSFVGTDPSKIGGNVFLCDKN